jgi:hypothetical protein
VMVLLPLTVHALICGFHPSVWYKGLVLVQVPVLITLCVIWCVPRCGLL